MEWTTILRPESRFQLLKNHKEQLTLKGTSAEKDYEPCAKLFLPWTSGTWLLTECDADGLAFGLCDLGFGTPECGYVSLDEIIAVRGPGGLHVEEDIHFRATKTLNEYAREALSRGYILA
jgi:hypothetical protein